MKPDSTNRHNNDIPVIEDILRHTKNRKAILFVREDFNYTELRALIGMTDYYVASRFHAMISALYTKRPVLVFGWGYQKYTEVMNEFELSDYVFAFDHMTKNNLTRGFDLIVKDKAIIQERIEKHLAHVIKDSKKAVHMIKSVIEEGAPIW
jgi:polysaccharide pyruvyl transferase WcaK-like protein